MEMRRMPSVGVLLGTVAVLMTVRGGAASGQTRDGLHLRLNLPAYGLEVYEGERLAHRYRVSIGDTAFPTPAGRFEITRVEWDPWWIPPPSEWAAGDSALRPGPGNPMGRVKLYWRDMYFLHGTPYRASVGAAASHGCVRMLDGDAVALARLVHRYGSPGIPDTVVEGWAAKPGKTQLVELERPVPLEITYDLVELVRDTLIVYPDVYHRIGEPLASRVLTVLADSGYNTALVDRAELDARLANAGARRIPVARLMAPEAPSPTLPHGAFSRSSP